MSEDDSAAKPNRTHTHDIPTAKALKITDFERHYQRPPFVASKNPPENPLFCAREWLSPADWIIIIIIRFHWAVLSLKGGKKERFARTWSFNEKFM